MDPSTFILTVFCLVDDWLEGVPKLRRRGPSPKLYDSEVLTMEVVGEYLGIDTEKGLYAYFKRHYRENGSPPSAGSTAPPSPASRPTPLGRQGRAAPAPLGAHRLRPGHLLDRELRCAHLPVRPRLPMPAFGRGVGFRLRCEMNKQTFYGLRGHLRVCWPGVVVEADLAPANAHDLRMAEELLKGADGWAFLGDRNSTGEPA